MDLIWATRRARQTGLSAPTIGLHNGPECLERAWAGTAALSSPRVIALVEG
jgi:hypothetical protein